MKSASRAFLIAGKILAVLLLFLAVGLAFVGGLVRIAAWRALPQISGTRAVAGLAAPATIARDPHGIPLITAASEDDAYFALGYVHAQDRLFEMEMMRRQGQGRLAEVVGEAALPVDRFMRTLGVYRRAKDDLDHLDAATQRAFTRYADGVNAWLGERHPLPVEFGMLQISPAPWLPADSLVWQKLMGLELSGNWDEELFQAALVAKLGPRANNLFPAQRPTDAVTVNPPVPDFGMLRLPELHKVMTDAVQPITASNVWTVNGQHAESGKPLLANDPHLNFQTPSIWYFVGIDTPTLKLFGATIPGVPLHIAGHNERLAWGLTTTHGDTSDLFIEDVSADGKTYATPDGPQPFVTRTETIRTRFGAAVTLTVRETRHGPVVSDLLPPQPGAPVGKDKVLALAATVLSPEDHSGQALYHMNRAETLTDFLLALTQFDAPQQNIMVANTTGGIGYMAAGRVPIRKQGDGTVPVEGATGAFDWTGWIPFPELPRDFNPRAGILVNANNKMVPDTYPYLITAHWQDPYRANRITELLKETPKSTVASTKALQQDVVSLMAKEMLPLLMSHAKGVAADRRAVLDHLAAWDGSADGKRWEPLVFAVWMDQVKHRLLADELGELYRQFGGAKPDVLRKVLNDDPSWCDDITTPEKETCDQQVAAAWDDTLAWLRRNGVSNPEAVQWQSFHVASFPHILFGNFPIIGGLGGLSIPTSGDTYTVNRGTFTSPSSKTPFQHVHGSSMRAIYDLSDLSASQFALPGGESGLLWSAHYGDLLTDWRDGRYFTAPTAATATDKLTLTPRK